MRRRRRPGTTPENLARLKMSRQAAENAASRIEDLAVVAPQRGTGIFKWMQNCPICKSPDRREYNKSILGGLTYGQFAQKWGDGIVSLNQYMRHRREHCFGLVRGLFRVDSDGTRMLRIMKFPLEGTAYEQADFIVKQLGCILDRRRFGQATFGASEKFDPYAAIRSDCLAILAAIRSRETFRGELTALPSPEDSTDIEVLNRAAEIINEQRAGLESATPAGEAGAGPAAEGAGADASDSRGDESGVESEPEGERTVDLDLLGTEPERTGDDTNEAG